MPKKSRAAVLCIGVSAGAIALAYMASAPSDAPSVAPPVQAQAAPVPAPKPVLAWKQPTPGTHAFAGDDGGVGGSTDALMVCDTPALYKSEQNTNPPDSKTFAGCRDIQPGTPVIIDRVVPDPMALRALKDDENPVAQITVPSMHNYTGYATLMNIAPDVPVGAIILLPKGRDAFAWTQDGNPFLNDGPVFSQDETATVLRYDPTDEQLFIKINSGNLAGKTGWVPSGTAALDGKNADQFYKSFLDCSGKDKGDNLCVKFAPLPPPAPAPRMALIGDRAVVNIGWLACPQWKDYSAAIKAMAVGDEVGKEQAEEQGDCIILQHGDTGLIIDGGMFSQEIRLDKNGVAYWTESVLGNGQPVFVKQN